MRSDLRRRVPREEDFQEEESKELLPDLHLSSDCSCSSFAPPYMRWACLDPCAVEAPMNAAQLRLLDHP